jgi:hypothetical protein
VVKMAFNKIMPEFVADAVSGISAYETERAD